MSQLKIKNGNNWESIPAGGVGVPSGGTTGQVLQKSSNTDYATEWATPQAIATEFVSGTTDNYGNILLSNLTSISAGKIINIYSTDHKVFCLLFTDENTSLNWVKAFSWSEPASGTSTLTSKRNTTMGLAIVHY